MIGRFAPTAAWSDASSDSGMVGRIAATAAWSDGPAAVPICSAMLVGVSQATLQLLQRDLDAAGLEGRVTSQLVGHLDAASLLEDEHDPDRAHAGTVGLSRRLPRRPASVEDQQTRAVAEALQSMLIEVERVQWPVCIEHSGNLLTARASAADGVVWVCATAAPHAEHLMGRVGQLAQVSATVGFRGRLPRRQRRN